MMQQWWNRRWFALLFVVLTALPIAFAAIPPLIDLPAHLGRYAIELDGGHSPDLARYYGFHWRLLGNLGVDLAIIPFAKLFGLENGLQLLIAATAAMSAAGLLLIAREAHGRLPATAVLALPLVYGYFLMFGFLNYCLGLALAYLAFALWLHLSRTGRSGLRAILFVPISLILWVAHIEAWAVAALMCWGALLVRRREAGRSWVGTLRDASLASLPFAAALVPMILLHGHSDGGLAGWFALLSRLKWLATVVRDRWMVLDLPLAAILYAAVAAAAAGLGRLRLVPVLALPAAGLLLFFLLLPTFFLGTSFGAERLLAPALALLLLAIDPSRLPAARQRHIAGAATALVAITMIAHAWSFHLYDRSYRRQLAAIDHIDRGSAVLALTGVTCRPSLWHWANSRLAHIQAIAIERKHAFTNDQFAISGQQLLDIRYGQAEPFTRTPSAAVSIEDCPFVAPPIERAIDLVPRRAFRYAWIVDVPRPLWPKRPWLRPIWSGDNAVLYRIAGSP